MSFEIPTPTEPLTPEREAKLLSLMEANEVVNIEVVAFSGQRFRPGAAPNTEYQLAVTVAGTEDRLQYQFDVAATLGGEDAAPVAEVKASIVMGFRLPEGFTLEQWVPDQLSRTALHMGYPHLREAIQSLASRLGYLGVVMPVLRMGNEQPFGRVDLPAVRGGPEVAVGDRVPE